MIVAHFSSICMFSAVTNFRSVCFHLSEIPKIKKNKYLFMVPGDSVKVTCCAWRIKKTKQKNNENECESPNIKILKHSALFAQQTSFENFRVE